MSAPFNLHDMATWSVQQLEEAVRLAPHLDKDRSANREVWLGCFAQAELTRRKRCTEPQP